VSQTIVVTGGGSGIGRAIAEELDAQGYHLILMGRTKDSLEQTQTSLKHPDNHQIFPVDIRKPDDLWKALQASAVETLHAVVVNAGVGGENHYGDDDRWQEIVDTNLTGSYHTIRQCLPYLKQPAEGFRHIVILSSILARLGVPGYSAYCASKAGLLGLMRSLANELTADKILVNALCPGWVDTAMARQGLQGFAEALSISEDEAYQKAMSEVPLGKMSTPQEIAGFVQYLVSDAQTSITGQTLDINNGALMP